MPRSRAVSLLALLTGLALAIAACGIVPGQASGVMAGGDLYRRHCATCHGLEGGRIPAAPLNSPAFLRKVGDAGLAQTIANGKGIMPAWGKERGGPFDQTQIQEVVAYLLSTDRLAGPGRDSFVQHCVECHGVAGDRIPAAPLNSADFLGRLSDQDLTRVISDGKGAMLAFGRSRGGPLDDSQIAAVVKYLRLLSGSSGPGAGAPTPSPGGAPASASRSAGAGKALFAQNCAMCHGAKGDQLPNANLSAPVFLQSHASDLPSIIANGKGGMPAFGSKLSSAQIQDVVAYLNSAAGIGSGSAPASATPGATATAPTVTAAEAVRPAPAGAQDLFTKNCAVCHASRPLPKVDPTTVHRIITDGIASKGMPAFGGKLSNDEIDALAQLIASGKATDGSTAASPFAGVIQHIDGWIVKHPSFVKENGAQLCYRCHQNSFCASCHTGGRVGG